MCVVSGLGKAAVLSCAPAVFPFRCLFGAGGSKPRVKLIYIYSGAMEADMLQLSAQLTQAIALVELQRATVEESILRLFGEAQQLNQVSDALCEAATTQGTVLIHLQQLLQSGKAPSEMAESLAPAALGIAAASGALAAPPPSEPGPSWSVGEAGGPVQGDTVWHDGQQCTVQYVNSKGLLDLRNQGGAVFYGVAKVELSPPGREAHSSRTGHPTGVCRPEGPPLSQEAPQPAALRGSPLSQEGRRGRPSEGRRADPLTL